MAAETAVNGGTLAVPAGGAQRLLATGGILLIVAGMIFGDIFAVFILHPNNARIGAELAGAAAAVSTSNHEAIYEHLSRIGGFLSNRGSKVAAHDHAIQFGILALLLALAQPWVALSTAARLRLARLFMVGAVILPPAVFLIHYVGLAYSPFSSIGWASVVADTAGVLVILASLGFLVGIFGYMRGVRDHQEGRVEAQSPESRMLLRGGALLLLLGMLYGAFYAAGDYDRLAASEGAIMDSILTSASAGDEASLNQAFGDYGAVAAEKAIKIAAHAHVNQVALLALLLAFIQHLVFLDPKWKRRWAGLFLVGCVGLPVSIMMELRFGLLAGGFADTFGLMLIVSLFAMMFGVWRHTGRVDTQGASS